MFRAASDDDIEAYSDSVTCFIRKCIDDVVPTKTIRPIYPNQKPWINSDVRSALSARTSAFKSGNTDDRKQASYDLKRSIKAAKRQYKNKVQIKSLLLSHHHSTSALVSEILMSVLQTVQKKQQTIYIWTDSAKKTALEHLQCSRQCKKTTTTIYIWTDSAKKQQTIYIWTDSAKKLHWSIYSAPDSAKKTTTIYIWTVHMYRLYRRQCAKYTYIYSVHIVYYKDTLNYQRHIIHRMGTSTLCTVSIHNVVYTQHSHNMPCTAL